MRPKRNNYRTRQSLERSESIDADTAEFVLSSMVGAVAFSATLVFLAAGIGWLVGSSVLAGTLAKITSALLILGYGGISNRAKAVVALSFWFGETLLSILGISGMPEIVIIAAVYLVLGMTKGRTQYEILYIGTLYVPLTILGIIIEAVVNPNSMAHGVNTAVISVVAIAVARTTPNAKNYYEQIMKSKPNRSKILGRRGNNFYNQGMYEQAIEAYNESISLDPNNAKSWNNKGLVLCRQGKYDEAIEACNEAIRLDPDLAEAWNNKGLALGGQGKYNEAIEACNEAIKLDPTPDSWCNIGEALRRQGKYEEAIRALDEAIELDANHANSWINKGEALKELGRTAEADEAFARANELAYMG